MLKLTNSLVDSHLRIDNLLHALRHHPALLITGGLLVTLAAALVLARDCVNARRHAFYHKRCIQRCRQLPDPLKHGSSADEAGGLNHELRKQLITCKNQLTRINTQLRPHPATGILKDPQLSIVFPRALRVRRVVSVYERTELREQSASGVTTVQHRTDWVTRPLVIGYTPPSTQASPSGTRIPRYGGTLPASALTSSLASAEWTVSAVAAGSSAIHVHAQQIADQCNWWLMRPVTATELQHTPQCWKQRHLQPFGTYLYATHSDGSSLQPRVGDIRVQYFEVPAAYCAIVGQLRHDEHKDATRQSVATVSLVPYTGGPSNKTKQLPAEHTPLLQRGEVTDAETPSQQPTVTSAPSAEDASLTSYTRRGDEVFIIDREVDATLQYLIRKQVGPIGCLLADWLLRLLCLVMTLTGITMVLRALTHELDTVLLCMSTLLAVQWLILLECIAWATASSILLVPCTISMAAIIYLTYDYLMPLLVGTDN